MGLITTFVRHGVVDHPLVPFTLPAATGGEPPIAYSIAGLPAGLALSSDRSVSGTPTATGTYSVALTAMDANGGTDSEAFDLTVAVDTEPTFGSASIPSPSWTAGTAVTGPAIPEATGGNPPLDYAADGLPDGVELSAGRVLTGAPTGTGSGTATITVTDLDGDTDTVGFAWTVTTDGSGGDGTVSNPHLLSDPVNVEAMDIFGLLRGTGSGDNAASATYFQFTVPGDRPGDWTIAIDGTPNSGADWDLKGGGGLSSASSSADESGTVTLSAGQAYTFRIHPYRSHHRPALSAMTLTLTPPASTEPVPAFGVDALPLKSWIKDQAIEGFTVPEATGGDAPLTYTSSGWPGGVGMDANRAVSGTPTAAGSGAATVTVTDDDGDTDTLRVPWTVAEAGETTGTGTLSDPYVLQDPERTAAMDIFSLLRGSGSGSGSTSATHFRFTVPSDQAGAWTVAIDGTPDSGADWDLRGDGGLSSASSSADESGTVSLTAGQRYNFRVYPYTSGARFALTGLTLTLTPPNEVREEDPEDVPVDRVPDFGDATVSDRSWTRDEPIAAFTVPAATGGDGALTHTAAGLPAGVTMSSARLVSGTPAAAGSGTATVTAADADGDTDTLAFDWTVAAPAPGTPGSFSVPFLSTTGRYEITWGASTGATRYELQEQVGSTWSSVDRLLPAATAEAIEQADSGTYGYRVRACNASGCGGWTAAASIVVRVPDKQPTFGTATVAARTWVAGVDIVEFPAPAASGGDGELTYGARGLPGGVRLVKASGAYKVSGTPTAAGTGTAILAAQDADGDVATLSFAWTVAADTAPDFGAASVAKKTWTVGQAITAFTLPSATGGNAPLSYGVGGLPDGVIVSPSLQVSGTPLKTGSGTATLTARDSDGDTDTLSFAWSVASPNAPNTGAVLSVTPNPTTGPDYTVVGTHSDTTTTYDWFKLTESGPWTEPNTYHPADGSFRLDITNRANGRYTYALVGCYLDPLPNDPVAEVEVCETLGETLTVTVNGPAPDSVSKQLADTYEVRAGHFDEGSLKDLYIKRTSTAAGGGLMPDVILRQASGGGFDVLPAPPGSANAAKGSTWTASTAVEAVLNDINLDGFVDILLRGVGSALGAGGVLDQILYAPGRRRPDVILNAVDTPLKDFLNEVSAWTRNPNYFNERKQYEPITRNVIRCRTFQGLESGLDINTGEIKLRPVSYTVCTESEEIVGTTVVYTNSSFAAWLFAEQFSLVDGRINPDVTLGSQKATNIDRILSSVLGVEIFNGRLRSACTGAFAYDTDIDIRCNDARALGLILLHHGTVIQQIDEDYDPKAHRTVTPVGRQRDLTDAEKTLAEEQGLDSIELSRVVVEHAPESLVNEDLDYLEQPMRAWYVNRVHRYTIYVPEHIEGVNDRVHFMEDFTKEEGIERQSNLVHELVHLHQHHDPNWRYDVYGESFEQVGIEAYGYRSRAGTLEHDDFREYSGEEQAAIVEDRFRLNNGVKPRYDCINPPRVNWPCNTPRDTSIETMSEQLDNLKNIPKD